MQSPFTRGALAAAALLIPAAGAQAQFLSGNNIAGCGGNTFISCVVFNAAVSGNTLTFHITNNSGGSPAYNTGSVFTIIGLGNLSGTLSPTSFSASGSGGWTYDLGVNGFNGFGSGWANNVLTFGADANSPAPANGLKPGQSATFTFTFAPSVTQQQLMNEFANAQVAIHDQGGFGTCGSSSKAVFNTNGVTAVYVGTSTTCAGSPPPPPPNTVPEPSSMALLGTGLVGLIPMIRRKKK